MPQHEKIGIGKNTYLPSFPLPSFSPLNPLRIDINQPAHQCFVLAA